MTSSASHRGTGDTLTMVDDSIFVQQGSSSSCSTTAPSSRDDLILALPRQPAGNDTTMGDGDDVLAGGLGNDMLVGGEVMTVHFNLGDGQDVIDDSDGSADALVFGAGIASTVHVSYIPNTAVYGGRPTRLHVRRVHRPADDREPRHLRRHRLGGRNGDLRGRHGVDRRRFHQHGDRIAGRRGGVPGDEGVVIDYDVLGRACGYGGLGLQLRRPISSICTTSIPG